MEAPSPNFHLPSATRHLPSLDPKLPHRIMTFEDLESWQRARQLTREIYTLTRQGELARDFGLCGQIQRASVSIMSNVAEGFERHHIAEKIQFYNVARGSSAEVRSLLYVIQDNYPSSS